MTFRQKLLSINWLLLVVTILLACLGLVAVYSATYMRTGIHSYLAASWVKQAVFLGLGLTGMAVVMFVDYRWYRWLTWPAYLASVAMLLFLHFEVDLGFIRSREVYNAVSWIEVGGFVFQPSQVAILSGILAIAVVFTQFRHRHPILLIIIAGILSAIPAYLIMEQPDNGSMLVWGPVVLTMLFLGNIPLRYIFLLIIGGAFALPVAYDQLDAYAQERLTIFLDPFVDPRGAGWNTIQSLIAVGSGGLEGKGFLAQGTQNTEGFLPPTIAHNDFIFAVLAEEHGFRGAILIIVLLAVLLMACVWVGLRARDNFGLLLVGGIIAQMFAHIFMNIGMTIQLTPITGLPLPLLSYGGTFLLLTLISLGIVQSVWIHRNAGKDLKPPVSDKVPEDEDFTPEPDEAETVLLGRR